MYEHVYGRNGKQLPCVCVCVCVCACMCVHLEESNTTHVVYTSYTSTSIYMYTHKQQWTYIYMYLDISVHLIPLMEILKTLFERCKVQKFNMYLYIVRLQNYIHNTCTSVDSGYKVTLKKLCSTYQGKEKISTHTQQQFIGGLPSVFLDIQKQSAVHSIPCWLLQGHVQYSCTAYRHAHTCTCNECTCVYTCTYMYIHRYRSRCFNQPSY